MNENQETWPHHLPIEQIYDKLQSSPQGLGSQDAQARLARDGQNRVQRESQDSALRVLWRQINNPLIWVLLGAGGLAMFLGKLTDGAVVLAVVIINGMIGFVQEFRAGRAIEALTEMVPQTALVERDGRGGNIDTTELVVGDVVLLAAGDSVPADMRLIEVKNLQVDEAALTGESVPVEKDTAPVPEDTVVADRRCMVHSGTLVTAGTARAIVVRTGMRTELGKISGMLATTVDLETPLTQKLTQISLWITVGIGLLSAVILLVGVLRAVKMGMPLFTALQETLLFAIALAVGAIPEGLPAVVTIALAIGVQRMARRNAIIRHLPAVETLGATTVICSDKTGTLTCNEMTVTQVISRHNQIEVSGEGYVPEGNFSADGRRLKELPTEIITLLRGGVLCNDASLFTRDGQWQIGGDPTEAALLVVAQKAGLNREALLEEVPRKDVIPFASEAQLMLTLHGGRHCFAVLKGAPEKVLQRCQETADPETLQFWRETVETMSGQGMRVLALAQMEWDQDEELPEQIPASGFSCLGLVGMIDPPRPEAVEAIKACYRAGIQVKMITGDHHLTAAAIGKKLQLAGVEKTVTGAALSELSEEELRVSVHETNIFARVAPEHKLRLVRALQRENDIVAMTGDGVNDAPSLKQANIGVAMGITGTAVSKESADIVLTDDNFASIGAAVEEGRRVYDNLVKSLAFLLPTNLGLAFILIYGIIFFPFDPETGVLLLPMLPTQLLWINLVAAVALALPLAFEVQEPDVMHRPPRDPQAPLLGPFILFRVVLVSILMTAGAIGVFYLTYAGKGGAFDQEASLLAQAQSSAVSFVIFFQIFYMMHCRSLTEPIRSIGYWSNRTVFPGVGIVLVLQALFLYLPLLQNIFHTVPLTLKPLATAFLVAAAIFPLISMEKWLRKRFF